MSHEFGADDRRESRGLDDHGETHAMELQLAVAPTAPALGRRALQHLRGRLPQRTFEDLLLVATEMISNAVVHAGLTERDSICLRVRRRPRLTRLEVEDHGIGFGRNRLTPPDYLTIIARLSERWGLESDGRTLVWCELRDLTERSVV
jgi:anti-sigma regulatory factor (Ser/Thr protein kinase)